MVWSCGLERKRGLGGKLGGGCKAKREAKEDLVESG